MVRPQGTRVQCNQNSGTSLVPMLEYRRECAHSELPHPDAMHRRTTGRASGNLSRKCFREWEGQLVSRSAGQVRPAAWSRVWDLPFLAEAPLPLIW